ncbi:conjugal transfer protein TraF [Helicobacter equorum]|uniref:OMP40 n=1 Tax=Helicobacter equorum TaxID=361872 RepID=A0A1M4NGM2_9HELI|nr:conjugal transfer protein TraF [Helicobacter equorum]SFZ71360.1 OMP40 [Helicobacter equorum]
MQLFSHIRITTRCIYINLCFLACMHTSLALGFGSMGQVSSSIGGAGVALKNSAWGIYYNPALLGADRRTKIGYSFGAQLKEQNILEIATNISGLSKIGSTLGDKLLGGAVAGGAVSINGQSVGGVFGDTLQNLFGGSTTIDSTAISKLGSSIGLSSSTYNDLEALGTALKGNSDAAGKLKNELLDAANKAGAPSLLTGILSSIDPGNIGELLTSIKSGNVNFEDIIKNTGGITIPKGADSDMDQLISAFETMKKAIEGNEISITSQNGLVLQIGGRQPTRKLEADGIGEVSVQESDNGRGAVAIGILPQVFASISAQIDPNHRRLIVGIGSGCDPKTGANCTFIEATPGGNGVSLKVLGTAQPPPPSGLDDYNKSSILTGNHTPYGVVLGLVEIPIAYGHTFYTRSGDINVGIAPKFILASAYRYNTPISFTDPKLDVKFDTNTIQMTQTFGLDLGVLYTPAFLPNLNIGLVAKNLNAPKINLSGSDGYVRLTQQVRAGVSYEMLNFLTLALDVDVLPNDTLSIVNPKSQMLGGGILADFAFIDFRIGAMRDLYSKAGEGTILTTGVNLFGFLDVSVQYGLGKNVTLYGFNVSNYMAFRVGGQFSF